MPVSIQLTALVTPVIEGHDRTVLRSLTLTGASAVKPLLALLSLLKAKRALTASAATILVLILLSFAARHPWKTTLLAALLLVGLGLRLTWQRWAF